MKHLLTKLVLAVALTGPAAAGDWSGFYGGAQLGYTTGDLDPTPYSMDGADYGVHAGYNFDLGEWVLGVEASYSAGTYELSVPAPIEGQDMAHIKLRAGYDLGQGMVYGVAGWAQTTLASTTSPDSITDNGYVFGLGYEHMVSDKMSIGAEYNRSTFDNFNGTPLGIDYDTVQARISFHF